MPTTRSEEEKLTDVWQHLLKNILRPPASDPDGFKLVLENNGVTNIFDLLEDRCDLSNTAEIETWSYDDSGTNRPIKKFEIHKLMTLRDFIFMQAMELKLGSPAQLTLEQMMGLKREAYDIMRTTRTYRAGSSTASSTTPATATTTGGSTSGAASGGSTPPSDPNASYMTSRNTVAKEIISFDRSIKRDPSLFPTLKNDEGFDQWNRGTIAQARVQSVSDILNPKYVPSTPDELELFNKKQSYMYAAFEKGLQTDQGKSIVRAYQADFDAQKIYADVVDHYTQSVFADLDSGKYMEYIITADLGNGKWSGNTHSFVLHWQEQVRRFEALVEDGEKFSESLKLTLLANAVANIEELRQVRTQAKILSTQTEKPVTYNTYCSLLLDACAIYDKKMASTGKKGQRRAYNHDIFEGASELTSFDIDTPNHVIEANFRRFGPSLTKGQWNELQTEDKDRWDQFDPNAKSIILQHHKPPSKPKGMLPPRNDKQDERNVSFHENNEIGIEDPTSNPTSNPLMAYMTNKTDKPPDADKLHPANLQRLLSQPQSNKDGASMSSNTAKSSLTGSTRTREVKETIVVNGRTYTANMTRISLSKRADSATENGPTAFPTEVNPSNPEYRVSQHARKSKGSLIDRGANGGVMGNDMRIINSDIARKVDITGIADHQITDITIGTCGGVTQTANGPIIVIFPQFAIHGKGKSIISCGQLEAAGCEVNDKSRKVKGGKQVIISPNGYTIPLSIKNGLAIMKMRPYTDDEWESLPHELMTDDIEWDPTILDNDCDDDEEWHECIQIPTASLPTSLFDETGDYRKTTVINLHDITDDFLETYDELEMHIIPTESLKLQVFDNEITPGQLDVETKEIDYEQYIPNFAWQPVDTIKKTFECTTQYGRLPQSDHLTKHFRSPNPALNVKRRNEDVATDSVYSDVPAIDNGSTQAQFFCGTSSEVCDIYGTKTDSEFVNTLQDNIRRRGAMDRLLSDRAQVEISKRVLDILRYYIIGDWQSEPLQQHQNPAERKYQTLKRYANVIMARTGSPAYTWLLAMMYICFILNHTACATLNWTTPMQALTGTTSDISAMLRFRWWELVYYKLDDGAFPSDSPELVGHWVGFSETVGNTMCYKVLTQDTNKVIHRSNIRSAENPSSPNWRAMFDDDGEMIPLIVKSKRDGLTLVKQEDSDDQTRTTADDSTTTKLVDRDGNEYFSSEKEKTDGINQETGLDTSTEIITNSMPIIPIEDMIGRTFLMNTQEDGQKFRARIVEAIKDQEHELKNDPRHVKFKLSVNDDQYEELMSYNDIMQHIENADDDTRLWKFRQIVSHEGPLKPSHPNWRGSGYNIMVEWENGEITTEPLTNIAADDPVTCAIYARDHNLLDTPGWKRFKSIAKRQKKLFRMANQAKLRSFRTAPKYMYGFEVPRDWNHAIELDTRNGNKKWRECTFLEMTQIDEYEVFIDKGMFSKQGADGLKANGYKKIKVHLIYAVKHDGRHKARCVADGHLTDVPVESVYSGVVSLRGIRMIIFLAELNNLKAYGTDIGNAYLEAYTTELVFIVAGPEFQELQGHILVISKALYGLRLSGKMWHARFSAVLREEGFKPCLNEPDVWLRRNDDIFEYVAVYVDDLCFAMKEPDDFADKLINKYRFKLKGTGPIQYHLGCDFVRDEHGTLCMQPKKYINRMVDGYIMMFGEKPNSRYRSPLEENDHPEIDCSEFLGPDDTAKFQSLVGSMQWAISLGRIDIATACMTLSGFRSCPRKGHLERAKRVVGYLSKMNEAMIRFRTEIPDLSDLQSFEYEWDASVYGDVREDVPHDAPEPLGRPIVLIHYIDANLYHDMLTGRSVTGVLHFANQTPIDWYTKKQPKVECATYGSEFMAARTCVDQIIDLRNIMRYLGVPVIGKSYMFGDNEAVVNSSSRIHSKLHKRHNALSFHRVREAIASRMVDFYHIPGKINPADILSKHWSYGKVWSLLQPLLFWSGDTLNIENSKVNDQERQ